MQSAPIMSTLNFADHQLAIYDWPTSGAHPRGTVVLVHGLSEHAGRYGHVAEQLNTWGFDVRGYDQYGHGLSSGPRGRLPLHRHLVDDLAAVVAHTHEHLRNTAPLIVLGHSMGGLVATSAVARGVVRSMVWCCPRLHTSLCCKLGNGFCCNGCRKNCTACAWTTASTPSGLLATLNGCTAMPPTRWYTDAFLLSWGYGF